MRRYYSDSVFLVLLLEFVGCLVVWGSWVVLLGWGGALDYCGMYVCLCLLLLLLALSLVVVVLLVLVVLVLVVL